MLQLSRRASWRNTMKVWTFSWFFSYSELQSHNVYSHETFFKHLACLLLLLCGHGQLGIIIIYVEKEKFESLSYTNSIATKQITKKQWNSGFKEYNASSHKTSHVKMDTENKGNNYVLLSYNCIVNSVKWQTWKVFWAVIFALLWKAMQEILLAALTIS